MGSMDVLLFEWASAGGKDSRAFLPEGFAMLRTLVSSFEGAGCSTTAVASAGIRREAGCLECGNLVLLEKDPLEGLSEACSSCDAAFAIAPESGGVLRTVSEVLQSETRLLSCPVETIDLLSDKIRTYDAARDIEETIRIPPYSRVEADPRRVLKEAARIGLPCVVKPIDGAGSQGISLMRFEDDCRRACAKLVAGGWAEGLVQRYVQGRHLSATFIARGSGILPISINTQAISLSGSFDYSGGSLPFPLPQADLLWQDLGQLCRKQGLRGLMGIDFVLDADGVIWLMEANPRATTSCLGIEKAVEPGLASLITGSSGRISQRGYAQWATFPLRRTIQASEQLLSRVMDMPAVVAPPFGVGPFLAKGASKVLICVSAGDAFQLAPAIADVKADLSELHVFC